MRIIRALLHLPEIAHKFQREQQPSPSRAPLKQEQDDPKEPFVSYVNQQFQDGHIC